MSPEFVNLYIEKLLTELSDLTKVNVLLKTHLAYSEQQVAMLNKKLEEAERLSAKKAKKSESVEQTF